MISVRTDNTQVKVGKYFQSKIVNNLTVKAVKSVHTKTKYLKKQAYFSKDKTNILKLFESKDNKIIIIKI